MQNAVDTNTTPNTQLHGLIADPSVSENSGGGLLGSWGARVLAPVPTMDEFTRAHPYTGILLLGDFNQLPNFQLKPSPLQQIVTCPTRGNSILAKIYTNVTNWCQTPIIPKIHVSPSIFDNTTSSQPF